MWNFQLVDTFEVDPHSNQCEKRLGKPINMKGTFIFQEVGLKVANGTKVVVMGDE